ncbi:MAG: TIGR02444 family protein [Alphaproteobacteria bacterium]|nr:TIGR02444 family protein [Alphaproteobacteria bacterium]
MTQGFPSFAEALYARPGVAMACLDLQDRRSFDVALLLHACWLGTMSRSISAEEVTRLVSMTQPWRFEVVRPLRRLRRRLKVGPEGMPRQRSEVVREIVKSAELEAERALLAILESAIEGGPNGSVAGNLVVCFKVANIITNSEDQASLKILERETAALARDK